VVGGASCWPRTLIRRVLRNRGPQRPHRRSRNTKNQTRSARGCVVWQVRLGQELGDDDEWRVHCADDRDGSIKYAVVTQLLDDTQNMRVSSNPPIPRGYAEIPRAPGRRWTSVTNEERAQEACLTQVTHIVEVFPLHLNYEIQRTPTSEHTRLAQPANVERALGDARLRTRLSQLLRRFHDWLVG
jgi:hypothetical protein